MREIDSSGGKWVATAQRKVNMAEPLMRIAAPDRRALPRRFNFTVRALESLNVPPGRDYIWAYDTRVTGLAYRLSSSGAATFYWRAKVRGKSQRYRLGNQSISIDVARRLATEAAHAAALGGDPQRDRREARAEMTFAKLFAWYLVHAKLQQKRTWQGDDEIFKRYLQPLAGRRLTDITRADVAAVHAAIGMGMGGRKAAPYAANRALSLIKTVFNRAAGDLFDGPNPARGIKKFPETQRERFLQADELPAFFAALKKLEDPAWRDFFTLALLTGARRGNLQSMEWDEVNLSAGVWSIPARKFKTNKPMGIVLVPEAVSILRRRWRERVAPPEGRPNYVFPSYGAAGHITEPKMAWARLLEAAGIKDLRLHDLRRTLGSWQAATGASLPIIGKTLGHSQQQTTQIYARLNLDPVRASVGLAVDAMMKASKSKRKRVR
jgi:integrase